VVARIIGLTGGIASGKSTVASLLQELGAAIVDADQIAREVVAPETPALAEIAARFGPGVLDDERRLDRKKLGAVVFGDDRARADLNAITHPRIGEASRRRIAELEKLGADPIIYEAALLVENRATAWLDALIVVSVPAAVQLARLMERDQIGAGEARARLAAQLPPEDKVAAADHVVDNSGTLEETRTQVAELWQSLSQQSAAPTGNR